MKTKNEMINMTKDIIYRGGRVRIAFALVLLLIVPSLAYAASANNVSILYGWNGTAFVPVNVASDGSLMTTINMTSSVGLSPALNNTYDLGAAALLWSNLYARTIRSGGFLSIIGDTNVTGTFYAGGIVANLENSTGLTNVSLNYGYNGSNFVPLLTSGEGLLRLTVDDAQAESAINIGSGGNGTLVNLTVLKNLSVGSTTLFVDQTGTRIGIATASPAATLEVSGTNTVNNISLNVNNTLYVNNSGGGNVGIGTTGPTMPLYISAATHDLFGQHRQSSGVGVGQEMNFRFDTADGTDATYTSIYSEIVANTNLAPSGAMELRVLNAGTETTGIRIKENGNVGIGTTAPSAGLQINTSNPTLRTNGSVFIDGNVGIGTASPNQALTVVGDINVTGTATGNFGPLRSYSVTLANVSNTAASTTFLSFTIPANDMSNGDQLTITYSVLAKNNKGTNGNGTIDVFYGAASVRAQSEIIWSNDATEYTQIYHIICQRVGSDLWCYTASSRPIESEWARNPTGVIQNNVAIISSQASRRLRLLH